MVKGGREEGGLPVSGTRGLREVFAESTVPMLLADDGRCLVDANGAACRLLGLSLEEVRRLRIDDLTPPEARPLLDGLWESFVEDGSQAGRYELALPTGRRVEFDYSATANVEPGRHLSILLAVEEDPSPESHDGSPIGAMLTAREREIVSLIAMGATGAEVASQLHISPETVRNHVRSAREKLGAKTRAQAIAIALMNGEITV